MVLDLIEKNSFQYVIDLIKTAELLELIWVPLYMLITRKDIIILGEVPIQRFDGTTLTAEKNLFS